MMDNTLIAYVWEVASHVNGFSSITDEGIKIIKDCFDKNVTPKDCVKELDKGNE